VHPCERRSPWRPAAIGVCILWSACTPLAFAQDVGSSAPASTAGDAAAAPGEKFDVWEFRVVGSNVLERKAAERALYSHLGPGKTIADVEQARQALETAYRSAGYSTVFVDIPEQTVDAGVVRLNVTEGKLARLRVSGARYFSNRQILAHLPSLQEGEVPHLSETQRELAALNRVTADRSITPILRAGRDAGTVDVELRVTDDLPFHGSVEVNDRHTADTSKLRTNVNLSYDNLWQKAHSISLQYQAAPEERQEAKVIAGTYVARFDGMRPVLAMYAVNSSSDVATIGTLSVLGKGRIYGMRGILPLDPLGKFFHNLTLGIDLKDFDENIRLTERDGVATAIKYVNWSSSYAFGWSLPRSTSDFSLGTSWGMRGLGNDDEEFEQKRFKARANYAYLTGSAQHSRQIFDKSRFVARLSWQYANAPLISNEQFTAGGAASVRGYLEAERLGDRGASMSLEFHSPPLVSGPRVKDLHLFVFYDAAFLAIEDPLPGQDDRFRLSSTGVGLRFSGLGGLSAELDWAKALRDGANVLEGEDRVHFRLNYGF
jgi:hemolysin activation/secretion protein